VIVSAVRTPIASFGGALSSIEAPKLGATAVKAAVERANIDASVVDEVFLGNVCSANLGQAPARQVRIARFHLYRKYVNNSHTLILGCNLRWTSQYGSLYYCKQSMCEWIEIRVFGSTDNHVWTGTSLFLSLKISQHTYTHTHTQQNIVVAGGFESMSNIPYYVPKGREGYRYGHGEMLDGLLKDGLWDAYDGHHMGMCAENCADKHEFTREQQDEFAIESYKRSSAAHEAGKFKNEIVGVTVKSRKGETVVDEDEEFRRINFDKVGGLRPAFKKDGSVTAANASTLNDGASALIVMSAQRAKDLGLKPLAKIRGFGDAAGAPIDFPTAPSLAVPIALRNAGIEASDVDYHEVNEAFSVVALANAKLLNCDMSRVNVNGGAVSLGHPIGSSGARILVTLLNVLEQNDDTLGCASICNGGGGATALIVERM
jgi:acetyl-CoA C-acetyltransferase